MRRTRLEDDSSSQVDVPAIAYWLESLTSSEQRTDDEARLLAEIVKGSELKSHLRNDKRCGDEGEVTTPGDTCLLCHPTKPVTVQV